MIVERETKTHRSPVKSSMHRGRRGSALAWELRQTFTWTWFLSLLVIGGSLLFSWLDYQANLRAPAPPLNGAAHRITVVLDYIHRFPGDGSAHQRVEAAHTHAAGYAQITPLVSGDTLSLSAGLFAAALHWCNPAELVADAVSAD